MVKKEISEIKKQLTNDKCSISRICGCYVDGEGNKITSFKDVFLSLAEEDIFKYLEILRKTLSGTLEKNLLNMEFPIDSEREGGTQETLLKLRNSKLLDDTLLDEYYDNVIANYYHPGSYLILLIHDSYDVPGKSSDGFEMSDASDEVFNYIMCSICPVNLEKPCLTYDTDSESFVNRVRDWVVDPPEIGFLFPAFNERCTDIHSMLYFSKKAEELHEEFINSILGCKEPVSAKEQKDFFHTLITETLEDKCDFEVVKNIHDGIYELLEEAKDNPEPVILNKSTVKSIFASSDVPNDKMELFDNKFDTLIDTNKNLFANNVANSKSIEIKTADVIIKVKPESSHLIEQKEVDGKKCIVIEINDSVELNGISVQSKLF